LLIAFPKAQGVVLTALYLPVCAMLIGLILRGVAFDFRVKARDAHKPLWNRAFFAGSLIASTSQGWMLGRYITGFAEGWDFIAFAALIAIALPAAYVLLGAGWLIIKTEGRLQERAIHWAAAAWLPMTLGMLLISLATPWVSESVRDKWFSLPEFFALLPIPLATAAALAAIPLILGSGRVRADLCWLPFALTVFVCVMGFCGLAYSLFPWVVMNKITLWQAAAAPASLKFIFVGVAIVLPVIAVYTFVVYRIFKGKTKLLTYG
jgi:cytochrome bd ubiquinol oxidase subunit II